MIIKKLIWTASTQHLPPERPLIVSCESVRGQQGRPGMPKVLWFLATLTSGAASEEWEKEEGKIMWRTDEVEDEEEVVKGRNEDEGEWNVESEERKRKMD